MSRRSSSRETAPPEDDEDAWHESSEESRRSVSCWSFVMSALLCSPKASGAAERGKPFMYSM